MIFGFLSPFIFGGVDLSDFDDPLGINPWQLPFIKTFALSAVLDTYLGGGFRYFLFSPLLGEMIQFD